MFGLAVLARRRYWAPVPVTAKPGPVTPFKTSGSPLRVPGLDSAEGALVRKDLRSLVRRREMMIWIAIPTVFFLMSIVNWATGMDEGAAGPVSGLGSLLPMGLGVLLLPFYMSLVSFGQEGEAFVHLLAMPLRKHQIARAKLVASMIPACLVLPLVVVIIGLITRPGWGLLVAISILAVPTLLEASLIGLALGARFADFTEVPRARFVERKGAYIGMFVTAGAGGATISPVLLHSYLFPAIPGLALATSMGLIIATAICLLCYTTVMSGIGHLCGRETA
jgi:hypothetical protein